MIDEKTLDFAFLGQPYCEGKSQDDTNLLTLDFAYLGQPFSGGTKIGGNINLVLDYAYLGQPFRDGKAQESSNLLTLDFAYLGQPFCSQFGGPVTPITTFTPWACLM